MNLPQQPTEEVFRYAFTQVAAGVGAFDVQRQLVENGWAPQTAAFVMDHVRRSMQTPEEGTTNTAPAANPTYSTQGSPTQVPHTTQAPHTTQGQFSPSQFGAGQHGFAAAPTSTPMASHPHSSTPESALDGRDGSRVKIPWTVYRDLVVGLLALFIALLMAVAGISPIACFFAGLFGMIQVIRAVIIGGLSMYRI